jgi:uncharacterized protein (TIGR01777 family)
VWGRTYSFPGRRPVLVSSTKVVDASGRLMEVVRGGLGMTLQLSVQDAALCFRSTGYFVEIAGLRAPIPGWLTPGVADVRHSDGGDGAFRFTLAFRSPVAGAHLPPGRLVPRPAGRAVTVVLTLMLLQGALGAVDTLWHHELAAGLPGRPGARAELALHAARAAIYALVFLTVGWVTWDGTWAWVLAALLLIEVGITLQDFVLEDRTRRLPASERVLHTLMAIGFGAILALLTPQLLAWAARPSGFTAADHGGLAWAMTIMGLGVLSWAARDGVAVMMLGREKTQAAGRASGRTVLVTGATGFIGRPLVQARLARGDRVLVLARDPLAARATLGPAVTVVETLGALPAETRIDAVVNLAGAPVAAGPWTAGRRRELLGGRLAVTSAVIGLIERLETRPAVLVSASATGFYGDRGDAALDETAGPAPGFMSELCRRWEEEAVRAEALGVRVCRLRIGIVLDWSGGILPLLALPSRIALGAVIGDGRQWAPWIAREDVLRVIDRAIEDARYTGPINVVAPDIVTQGELTRAIAFVLRRPQWLRVPAWPLRAALGEMSDLLVASQRVAPTRLGALGFTYARPGLPDALERPTVTAKREPATLQDNLARLS